VFIRLLRKLMQALLMVSLLMCAILSSAATPANLLYNLEEDIGETTNLIDKYPRVAAKLAKMIRSFEKSMQEDMEHERSL
jgi:septal ring factor EnvC (AmiA/AmiB activator)